MSPERPEGLPARILELGEELRREGVAIGTSEILDAFAVLREISWTSQEDFREALAATLAKSQEDRRVFELVFERFFFRSVEVAAQREGIREDELAGLGSSRGRARGAARADRGAAGRLGGRHARPRADRDRGLRAPPGGLRGDRGRRAAHPPRARPARRAPTRAAERGSPPRRASARGPAPLRGAASARARALADRADRQHAALAPAWRASTARRRPARSPTSGCRAPRRRAAARRPATQGLQARGHRRHAHSRREAHDARSLQTGGCR
jgi:uncharacterized protein with von Willebrand factor type A (vWA) domain